MNSWFAKLISLVQSRPDVEALRKLDRALSASVRKPEPPPELAQRIRQSLRAAGSPACVPARHTSWRWLPAPAFALALLLGLWWFAGREQNPPPQPVATTLDPGQTAMRDLSAAVVAPLSQEWVSLHQDLDKTTDFLLASLP